MCLSTLGFRCLPVFVRSVRIFFRICLIFVQLALFSFDIYSSDISIFDIPFVQEFLLPSLELIMIFLQYFCLLVGEDFPISITVRSFLGNIAVIN